MSEKGVIKLVKVSELELYAQRKNINIKPQSHIGISETGDRESILFFPLLFRRPRFGSIE